MNPQLPAPMPGEFPLVVMPRSQQRGYIQEMIVRLALVGPVRVIVGNNRFDAHEAARSIRRHTNQVPAALERIVMDCLEKKPAARPETAAELDRRLAETGLGAGWSSERAHAWWQAHIPGGPKPCESATAEEQRARERSLHTIVEV